MRLDAAGERFVISQQIGGEGLESSEILTLGVDGQDLKRLTENEVWDLYPAWSPGRTKIAWVHYASGFDQEIYVANADGSNRQNLTNSPTSTDWQPTWSPDGTQIAFTRKYGDDFKEIWKMNANGSGVQKLSDQLCQSHSPAWSPDGQKIAFICGVHFEGEALQEVYIMSSDGSNQRRLTYDDAVECEDEEGDPIECPHYEDADISWAPDSTWITYVKYYNKKDPPTKGDIYKLNTSLSSPTQVNLTETWDTAEFAPDWSPAGDKIAFSGFDGSYEILVMNTNGSGVTALTDVAGWDGLPKWSSDASMIAFRSNRVDGEQFELYVMNADGTGQTRLTYTSDHEHHYSWRP